MSLFNSLILAKNVRESLKTTKSTKVNSELSKNSQHMPRLTFDSIKAFNPMISLNPFLIPKNFFFPSLEETAHNSSLLSL